MKIHCEEDSRSLFVVIDGDIDHHSSEEIRGKVDKAFERSNAKNIVFDFEKVSFMDSSGVGLLIGRYKMLENKGEGGKVYTINISDNVYRLFDISGLTKIIQCGNTPGSIYKV